MTDTLEKMVSAAKPGEVVPIMSGMTKMAGAFYYRIMLNVFSKGGYDDNFLDHKLPRFLPVISSIKSKLYPIARQVKKHYFLNTDMSDEDEFKPRFAHFLTVSQFLAKFLDSKDYTCYVGLRYLFYFSHFRTCSLPNAYQNSTASWYPKMFPPMATHLITGKAYT